MAGVVAKGSQVALPRALHQRLVAKRQTQKFQIANRSHPKAGQNERGRVQIYSCFDCFLFISLNLPFTFLHFTPSLSNCVT